MSTITKILVVEDDPCYRFILERFLKEFSQNLSIHSSAESAISAIDKGQKFDLILSDFNLPGRNGDYLLRRLRERGDETPYILLSNDSDVCQDNLGVRNMVNKILNKSNVCKEELVNIIKSVLALAVTMDRNKKKVLVADDEPLNLEAVAGFFDEKKYDLIYTKNGQSACEIAERELPDLIILDWKMPVMSGIEATQIINSNPLTKDIPIIISTDVMTTESDLVEALDKGAADFVNKPFDSIEFRARVNASLRLKAQNDEIKNLLMQEKKHFKETLELKEKELSTIAMYDYEKNLLLEKVVAEIRKIEDRMKQKGCNVEVLMNLRRRVRYQLNLEDSWKKFRRHFEQVHATFLERLHKKHPELSTNDIKICAYLKIGLDNAEMSQLVGIETSSVRKALSRLKQKLQLANSEGLRAYIQAV